MYVVVYKVNGEDFGILVAFYEWIFESKVLLVLFLSDWVLVLVLCDSASCCATGLHAMWLNLVLCDYMKYEETFLNCIGANIGYRFLSSSKVQFQILFLFKKVVDNCLWLMFECIR